jgi:acetyl esterase/lipase
VRHSLTDEAVFPAALYDVKTAIRWVKSRAVEAGERWCWRLTSTVM